ncbi:MAG: cell surface protein SprA [Candidatus Neomarinimicrobiota bacterium]
MTRHSMGSEPVQNILWDVNGRFTRDTPFITRLVDRLPFLETDAPSNFKFEGELAQVIPNPNPLGTAYIDDFEASKNVSSPTMRYSTWQFAAPPVGVEPHNRRKMAWWNPISEWLVKEIWPQRETSVQASNRTTTILVLDTFFDRFGEPVTDDLWNGISYQMFSSDYDQSKTKFFEIWLRGWQGEVHVDIGTISEDINSNGKTDTEDKPASGLDEGNGKIDTGEDIGLDGCSDETEDGLGGCLDIDDDRDGSLNEEIFNGFDDDGDGRIDEDISERAPLADENDPNGDNWFNTGEGVGDYYNDNVNGTEGNSRSPEGSYPDSEDLDGNGTSFLDRRNDYFSYSFRLEVDDPDTALVAGETRRDNGNLTGWRMFRIPLTEFEAGPGMSPSWNDVKLLRIWVDGMSQAVPPHSGQSAATGRIQIAKMEFVGNDWEEIGISPDTSDNFVRSDSVVTLEVTVANTEDNDDYVSPPGIEGEYDRLNDIRLREQSLVMNFEAGIEPGYKGAISKSITGNQRGSFLVYGTMDMFIYGRSNDGLMGLDTTFVWYFLRLEHEGQSGKYYYEVRKPVYTGWDARNHIHIDMEALAGLKLEDPTEWALVDGDSIPRYELDDMEVLIRGDPSLERIKEYTAGVINKHPHLSVHGQVLMDELRLSNVRRDRGMAMRLRGTMKFADLVTTSINYIRKDADFHTIQQRVTPNPVTTETIQGDIRFSPDRFLPQAWGVKLPIGMKYSRNISSPKYYPGRDIIASGIREAPKRIQDRTEQVDFNTSFDKSSRSSNWLVRQTFDRIQGGMSYSRKLQSSDKLLRFTSRNIAGRVAYPIKFSEENYVEPFKKLEPIPWLGPKLKDTRFYYTPSNLDFTANISENQSEKVTWADSLNSEPGYTLSLKRGIKAGYKVTDRFNTSYGWNATNSMDHLRLRKLEALKTLNTGYLLQYDEQYSANFNPDLFTWFKPKLNYQARFTWNKNRPIEEALKRGRVSNQGRFSGSVNLELKDFVEIFYTPESSSPTGGRSRRSRRNTRTEESEQKKLLEVENAKVKEILQKLHTTLSKINAIALSYSHSRNTVEPAVIGQPDLLYRMGLETATGLPLDTTLSGQTNISNNRDLSMRSGFNLGQSINVSLSHSRKWSSSKGSNATTKSSTLDYLAISDGRKVGFPFVNWSLRWSNLEKLPLLNKVPWRVSLDHSHNGSKSTNQQNDRVGNDIYKRQFQPLVGVTINFTNGISSNIRYSQGWSLARTETGDSKNSTQQATATMSYQHRGGLHLPLPFLKDLNLENSVNFSMDFDLSKSVDEERKGEASKFSVTRESRRWGIKPYITYTFSNKITGSLRTGYSEIFDDINGRRINREFGFDVNIAIRGGG